MNFISGIAFCVVLAFAAIAAAIVSARAKPAARAYARFAFALYFALALADAAAVPALHAAAPSVAAASVWIVAALAPALLALAVVAALERPPSPVIAGSVLAVACLCGFAAVIFNFMLLAFTPLLLAALAIAIVSLRNWKTKQIASLYAALSALALIAATASSLNGGGTGQFASALFSAAALLGSALAIVRRSDAAVPANGHDLRRAPVVREI